MRLGLAVPSFASPGAGLFRSPGLAAVDARLCLELAREAEDAGFDALWVADHLMIGRDDAVLEGWTLLAALAAATRRARLGLIQQSNLFRHPAHFAKAAATLDLLSGGRFTLFVNFGVKEAEHRAYGLDWPADEATRVERLGEALALMRALWRADGPVSYQGRHYRTEGAICRPAPVQAGGPPIWFAGTRPDHLANLAPLAAGWCTPPATVEAFAERRTVAREALAAAGRDPDAIGFALETQILLAESLSDLRAALGAIVALDPDGRLSGRPPLEAAELAEFLAGRTDTLPPTLAERWIVGTPAMALERFRAYHEAGADEFILWFMDLPDRRSFALFNEQVAPHLRVTAARIEGA